MVPAPVAAVTSILGDLWKCYEEARARGLAGEQALDAAMSALLPAAQVEEVLAFLAGNLDRTYGPPSGTMLRSKLLSEAESSYRSLKDAYDATPVGTTIGPQPARPRSFPAASAAGDSGKAGPEVQSFIYGLVREALFAVTKSEPDSPGSTELAQRLATIPREWLRYVLFHINDRGSIMARAAGGDAAGDTIASLASRAKEPHVRYSFFVIGELLQGRPERVTGEIMQIPEDSLLTVIGISLMAVATLMSSLCQERGGFALDYLDALLAGSR